LNDLAKFSTTQRARPATAELIVLANIFRHTGIGKLDYAYVLIKGKGEG